MKKLLLPLFVITTTTLTAQRWMSQYYAINRLIYEQSDNFQENFLNSNGLTITDRRELKIAQINTEGTNKSGKRYEHMYQYNSIGNLTYFRNKSRVSMLLYEADTLLTKSVSTTKKNNFSSESEYTNSKLTIRKTYKNNDLESTYRLNYDEEGKILKSTFTNGRNQKNNFELENQYENGNRKLSTFKCNGKIKRKWVYDCKEEGELVKSTKEEYTSSFCKYDQRNTDGSYIIYTRTIENGKPNLYKAYYTADSTLIQYEQYIHDTIILFRQTYSKNEKVYEQFNKKGHTTSVNVQHFDANGNLIERKYLKGKKGKEISRSVYKTNEQGLILESQRFYKGKLQNSEKYTYTFRD